MKRQVERQSSRRRGERPPVEEEEVEDVAMELEEEPEVPVMSIEEARKKKKKAMNSRDRIEEMGFGEILHMERMRTGPALTQALRSRWDTEVMAFVFPWGHMIPNLEDVSQITGLRVYRRPVSGFTYPCYHDIAERLLGLPVERRGDVVHCRFLPLLEDLTAVGGFAWGAVFLAHQFDNLGASERQTSTSGFYPFLQVWAYLHLPGLGRGVLERPGLVPIAGRWDSPRDSKSLDDQLTLLQEMIDSYPHLDVVWKPYLEEGGEGQPWLVQARPYFGRSVWLHALNLVLPLNLFLCQCSLGLRQSAMEFPTRDQFRRPGRSFRGLHDTTDWHVRAQEQINNWERRGKAVKSAATTDDAYLQAYALKYRGKVYKSARHQDRAAAQRQVAELRSELEKVRSTGASSASSSRDAGGFPSLLEARLAGAVLRAEEAHERNQLRIRAEAAEARVAEMTRELTMLRVQRPPGDQKEVTRLRAELLAQQTVARSLQQIVTDIGRSRSRSRSVASCSREKGGTLGQYLASSSSSRRNEEEGRHRQDESCTHQGEGGGGEMLPPTDRQEGSGECGGGK
ncbi:hypothetical protein Taro_023979 [Colocasia esculenta]|uniref:Aminotransferase-like plant mobile domain-containing protein n=1 Tax=Colocasia esculenta TaxID=4460 RepID=A0A843V695_COLES|nr:hypothetical protein [Colocasia esculenta]